MKPASQQLLVILPCLIWCLTRQIFDTAGHKSLGTQAYKDGKIVCAMGFVMKSANQQLFVVLPGLVWY